MGKSIWRSVGAIVGFGFSVAACSGTGSTSGNGPSIAGSPSSGGSVGSNGGGGNGGSSNGTLCIAGRKRCDGLNVKVCDDSGSKESIAQTCLPGQSCTNGACVGSNCVPGSSFCKDAAVWKCDQGGVSALAEQCASGLFCRAEADSASCSAQACEPSQPVCDGNVATSCLRDGSGPAGGGVDCSKAKQACFAGQCRDVACNNGDKLCQHGDVYLCSHNGTDVSLLTGCHSDEVCDADMGSCRSKLCDPGKVSCDGTRAQTCNAFGSAWLSGGMDCAADGKICVSGSCKKPICAANRSFCQDGSVYSCDASGTTATLSQTCDAQTEHCATYSGGSFGYCKTNDCHAGDSVCADNVIKVCNADGSLPASGTACTDTQICENAQCKDRPCVPGNYFCKGADVYYCDWASPFVYLSQPCTADTSCKALGTTGATCAPLACPPSTNACVGNKIGTCAADGQTLSSVTTDCTATTSICGGDLKCVKSAIDTLGVAENVEPISASTVVGDVVDVTSARKLTELQAQLVLAGPRELRWIVYELSGQTFVAKVDKVVSSVAGSGFYSSGTFNFSLVAGTRYLLAVVIAGGDAIDYIDSVPFSRSASFGSVVGRVTNYYPSTFDVFSVDTNYVTQMKVTTESP